MTAILGPPLGKLISWGSANFPAVDGDRLYFADVSSRPGNEPPTFTIAATPARDTVPGQKYPVSKTGLGPRPIQAPVLSWTFWLQATDGLTQAASWQDLERRLRLMQAWAQGPYDLTTSDGATTYTGTTGQIGDLVVQDANGDPRVCRCAWVYLPDDIPQGQVSFYKCRLDFRMLEHWYVGGVIYDEGVIYDSGAVWF